MKNVHWFFKVCFLISLLLFFWYLVSFILPKILPTRIVLGEIRGLIFQNQIWKDEIFITGDLITFPGVKIIILPGAKIFISNSGDKNNIDFLPWHLKNGINTGPDERGVLNGEPFWDEKEKVKILISNLEAFGEKDAPIILTSLGGKGSPYDINLIKIQNGWISKVHFSNYRRLEIGPNVLVSDSFFSESGECSICISSGNPLVKRNTFKNNKRNFLNVENSSPLITENTFLESEGDGILFQLSQINQIRVFNNTFQMPSKKAIKIDSINQEGSISGNNFILGDIRLPCSSKVRMVNNLIRGKVLFFSSGGCSGEYILLENYWEIMDIGSILNARVSGTTDHFSVKIPRILKSPPKGINSLFYFTRGN